MSFEQDIDAIVKRLNSRDLGSREGCEVLLERVRIELGGRATPRVLEGIQRFLEGACARHFGGDPEDRSTQQFLQRQVKRVAGRLAAPQEDGEIVWI